MRRAGRSGFTLVEMLVVLAMVTFLGGIMALLLKETLSIEKVQAAGFDRLLHQNALADQFRADVAQAEEAPAQWDNYQARPQTLILRLPEAGHVIYVWVEARLHRLAFDGKKVNDRQLPVDEDLRVEFEQTSGPAKRVILRLQTMKDGKALVGQGLEFVAALGGDWR
jgi:prepilin-type N-terminal cleavage/methylation domain-containing protein